MLAVWEYIEADFRRDYHIDLAEALPHMSWRQFLTLLHGLSPWGALATHYEEAAKQWRLEQSRASDSPAPEQTRFWNLVASL